MSTAENKSKPDSVAETEAMISDSHDQATGELNVVIDELLGQLSAKFSTVTSELMAKMEQMSERLDSLEAAIQANQDPDK